MSSTTNFSGFISTFSNTINSTDIITTVSTVTGLSYILPQGGTLTPGGSYYGRYFCLGNLLIQFIDSYQAGSPGIFGVGYNYTMYFPIEYTSLPYTVIVTPFNPNPSTSTSSDNNIFTTLTSFTNDTFTFHIGNNDGAISFLAIGPRPSSLYT